LEVLALREATKYDGVVIRWVSTNEMLADCLTKEMPNQGRLGSMMEAGSYCLAQGSTQEEIAQIDDKKQMVIKFSSLIQDGSQSKKATEIYRNVEARFYIPLFRINLAFSAVHVHHNHVV